MCNRFIVPKRAQCTSLLAAVGRRKEAMEMERRWARERVVLARALRHSHNIRRVGFAKTD